MSPLSKRRRNPSFTELQLKTRVLLIVIFNRNSVLITHDILYRLFSDYGIVQKLLIFEKSKLWKAFLEMEN